MEPTSRTYKRLLQYVSEESWAILPSYLALMRELLALRASGFRLSTEEIAERIGPDARTGSSAPSPAGIAVIPIWGVIGHRANELRDISSRVGTSTEILGAQIDTAIADPAVSAIVLDINSPGGGVFGVPEVVDQIRSQRGKKPIVASVNALGASAAYWIASAASEIVVTPSGLVGAIGVFSIHEDHSAELARVGVAVSLIKAGKFKADDNPFGPLAEDARAAIQQRVDAYFAMFARDVAKGRGTGLEAVRNGFGEGRVVDAKTAVTLGMADRVGTLEDVLGGLLSSEHATTRVPIAAATPEPANIQAETVADPPADTAIQPDPAAVAAGETPDVRQRRLRLRLLELGG